MPTEEFYAGQVNYIPKLNALWDRATTSVIGTSTDSLSISVASKTFTTNTNLQFAIGSQVTITATADLSKYMSGQVTAYDQETGDITVNVAVTNGSGTFSSWSVTLSGAAGATGAAGADGIADNISIGTVTSGTAAASITGTSPNKFLNLTLQTGATGAAGAPNVLSIGTVTDGVTADATITGTSPAQVLNLVLPKGDTGDTGATGAKGLNAKGAWNGATPYVVDDWVTYSGSSYYRKIAGTTGTDPSTDTTNWGLLAAKGADGAGAVSDVTATAPLASTGGATPNITIQVANTSQGGYLNSTDWNTFNSKQAALGFTPVNKAGDSFNGNVTLSTNQPALKFEETDQVGAAGKFRFLVEGDQAWFQKNTAGDGSYSSSVYVWGTDPSGGLYTVSPSVSANNTKVATTEYVVSRIAQDALLKTGGSVTGNVGIGSVSSFTSLNISKNITGASTARGITVDGVVQSDATASAGYYTSISNTAAATFTVPFLTHFAAMQGTIGAGSTVTSQYGFSVASSLVGATNNYAFISQIPAGANNWNLYMLSTAKNYLAGNLLIGSTTDTGEKLQVTGNTKVTGTLSVGGNLVGYLGIPQNSQSAAYTLVLDDAGKHLLHPSADTTARIFTIPANASVAFPIGTAISFINQNGGGAITIAITSDVMRLAGAGTTGSRTLAANGIATAIKVTATEWIISGVNLT